MDKVWSGRFREGPDPFFERFSRSLDEDLALFPDDIQASIAHVHALRRAGILQAADAEALEAALRDLSDQDPRSLPWREGDEDLHTGIERLLTERLGPLGARLHTGRSRNDQVAADLHLYAAREGKRLAGLALRLARSVRQKAKEAGDAVVPGMTHLQRAQPILLAHHLLAYGWMAVRDARRFLGASRSARRYSPLGAGALAGPAFALDPEATALELGCEEPYPNSLDAVSDRDFALELAFACALTLMHLSRLAEEMVLWATAEFSRIRLADGFSTGSSMMPQKRNPDAAELVRGAAGGVFGHLQALLVTLKGLPLAYMRDMQETKPPLFAAVRVTADCLVVTAGALSTSTFLPLEVPPGDFSVATDLADVLVLGGLPFREAHRIVGALAAKAEARGGQFERLQAEDFRAASPLFPDAIADLLDPARSVARRAGTGGTAPAAVRRQSALLDQQLAALEEALEDER